MPINRYNIICVPIFFQGHLWEYLDNYWNGSRNEIDDSSVLREADCVAVGPQCGDCRDAVALSPVCCWSAVSH